MWGKKHQHEIDPKSMLQSYEYRNLNNSTQTLEARLGFDKKHVDVTLPKETKPEPQRELSDIEIMRLKMRGGK